MFDIKEYIFDGVTNSPDVPEQGMDMHSFTDDDGIVWYPYREYPVTANTGNSIIKFNPATEVLEIITLELTGTDVCQAYQAIQGNDPDTIWIYSAYGTRALWKFSKSLGTSDYIKLDFPGNFGGKITSIMISSVEHIVATIVGNAGYPVAYRTSDGLKTELTTLPTGSYGIQNDVANVYMLSKSTSTVLTAFTLLADHSISVTAFIFTIGAVDLAWDDTDKVLWTASSTGPDEDASMIEKFTPNFTSIWATSFNREEVHFTTSPVRSNPASIKVNDKYVAVCWESGHNDPPTIGWNVFNKHTGLWEDFFSQVDAVEFPDYLTVPHPLYPFTGQFWTTVCIEIDVQGIILITGYSPALQGGVMNSDSCPNKSARILKLTPVNSRISDAVISGAEIS